jgi:hypothetical protein
MMLKHREPFAMLLSPLINSGAVLAIWVVVRNDTAVMGAPEGRDFEAPEDGTAGTSMQRHQQPLKPRPARRDRVGLGADVAVGGWLSSLGLSFRSNPPPFHDKHASRDEARRKWAAVTAKHGVVAVVWRVPVGCDFSGFFTEVGPNEPLGCLRHDVDSTLGLARTLAHHRMHDPCFDLTTSARHN